MTGVQTCALPISSTIDHATPSPVESTAANGSLNGTSKFDTTTAATNYDDEPTKHHDAF